MNIWRRARKLIVDSNKKTVDYAQSKDQTTAQTKSKPTDQSKAEPKNQSKPESNAETKVMPTDQPETKSTAQTKAKPTNQSKTESSVQTKSKPEDESETKRTKPEPTGGTWTKSVAQTKSKPTDESETKSAAQTRSKPKDESETKSAAQTKPKPEDESETKRTKPEPTGETWTKSAAQTRSKPKDESETKSAAQTKPKPEDESETKRTKPEPTGETWTKSAAQTKSKPKDESETRSKDQTKPKPKDESKPESPVPLESIRQGLNDIDDAVFRDYQTKEGLITVIYLSSLIDSLILYKTVVEPLVTDGYQVLKSFEKMEGLNNHAILLAIANGDTILYLHENRQYFKAQTFSPPQRAISPSEMESSVIGPQDSFTESLKTNISLIKRRIQQPGLKSKGFIIGKETNTKISVIYIKHLVNNENLQRIEQRIKELDYDGFLDITVLKQLVEDNPFSPFPQFGATSRPDSAVNSLLDGRIVIAMENSQSVMICPYSFLEMFNSPEDFYNRWSTATLLRVLRFAGFFITIMLTPTYISALSYHPGILPFELLIMIQESRSKVPFPPVIEVLFIELVIEILREAGSRMPSKIGQTIGIVGGIVIGTAAVEAGLVSNTLIVLVAVSALLSFLLPNFLMSNASRVVRYIFILAAGLFGLLGQMLALAWLFNHLLNLTSLGTPYMTPVIPRSWSDLKDSIIRFPLAFIQKRKGLSRAKQVKKDSK